MPELITLNVFPKILNISDDVISLVFGQEAMVWRDDYRVVRFGELYQVLCEEKVDVGFARYLVAVRMGCGMLSGLLTKPPPWNLTCMGTPRSKFRHLGASIAISMG